MITQMANELAALQNLQEHLTVLEQITAYPDVGLGSGVQVQWREGINFRLAHDQFQLYVARRVAEMLPQFKADFTASVTADVAAARANLAEIQARK